MAGAMIRDVPISRDCGEREWRHIMMKNIIRSIGAVTIVGALVAGTPVTAQNKSGSGGPKLTSGVLKVLEFDADWTQNMPNGAVFPAQCQTEPHLAGPNEVAIVNMNGFVAASGQSFDFIQLKAAISEDGWSFVSTNVYYTIDGLSDGAAHVSTTSKVPLNEGVTYVFGAQFQSGAPVVVGFSTCQGTITIVRLP
jgi:hypothetical protein